MLRLLSSTMEGIFSKVTDGCVFRTGVSVTWSRLSWSGGHEFKVGSNLDCMVLLSMLYLNQKYFVIKSYLDRWNTQFSLFPPNWDSNSWPPHHESILCLWGTLALQAIKNFPLCVCVCLPRFCYNIFGLNFQDHSIINESLVNKDPGKSAADLGYLCMFMCEFLELLHVFCICTIFTVQDVYVVPTLNSVQDKEQ